MARSAPLTASALVTAWPDFVVPFIEKDHFHSCCVMPCMTEYSMSRYFTPTSTFPLSESVARFATGNVGFLTLI